jgi:hypothetical protein
MIQALCKFAERLSSCSRDVCIYTHCTHSSYWLLYTFRCNNTRGGSNQFGNHLSPRAAASECTPQFTPHARARAIHTKITGLVSTRCCTLQERASNLCAMLGVFAVSTMRPTVRTSVTPLFLTPHFFTPVSEYKYTTPTGSCTLQCTTSVGRPPSVGTTCTSKISPLLL